MMNTPLKTPRTDGNVDSESLVAPLRTSDETQIDAGTTKRSSEIIPDSDDFEEQMKIAREVMIRRKRALQELAK